MLANIPRSYSHSPIFFLWNEEDLIFLIILWFSNKNLQLIWLPVDPGEQENSILLSLYSKQKVFGSNYNNNTFIRLYVEV